MNLKQKDFGNKYLHKIVRPLGTYYEIPIKEYIVTAALLEFEENGVTIFAIKALDYSVENKHWITIRIARDELEERLADFEILRDGGEEKDIVKLLNFMSDEDLDAAGLAKHIETSPTPFK